MSMLFLSAIGCYTPAQACAVMGQPEGGGGWASGLPAPVGLDWALTWQLCTRSRNCRLQDVSVVEAGPRFSLPAGSPATLSRDHLSCPALDSTCWPPPPLLPQLSLQCLCSQVRPLLSPLLARPSSHPAAGTALAREAPAPGTALQACCAWSPCRGCPRPLHLQVIPR